MKEMFESLTVRELMASITRTSDLIDFYDMGLSRENAFLTITAQNELARRGDSRTIIDVLANHIAKDGLTLGSDFTRLLSESLIAIGDYDASLKEVGRKIGTKNRTSSEDGKLSADDLQVDEEIPDSFYAAMKFLLAQGYDKEALTSMVENFYANTVPFPRTA